MNKLSFHPLKFLKGLLLFVLPFFPVSLQAEEVLPTIVVTADKKETLEENTAASVTVITRKEIEAQVGTTVPEVLQNLAGVNLVTLGSPGDDVDVRIRGSDRDEVLVLLDGVPINTVREHRANFLGIIPLEIVERIEVVRGSQSVLYGSDAVGGVINIITRRGSKRFEIPVSFEGGNLGTFRENLGLSGSSAKTEYFADFNRMDVRGRFPRDRFGGYTWDGSFSYKFHPKVEMNLGITYLNAHQDLFYEFSSAFDPATGGLQVNINPDQNNDFSQQEVIVHNQIKATVNRWWSLELLYGFFYDQDSSLNLGDNPLPPVSPGEQDFHGSGSEHTVDLRNYLKLYDSKKFSADLTVGFEFQQEKIKFNDPVNGNIFPDAGQQATRKDYAPYFLQSFRFLDEALIVSGGARFDHNTNFGDQWSPRGSLLYQLRKTGTTFRTSYGKGFHGPTILEFFTQVLQRDLGLPFQAVRLQAELSQSFEAGAEQKLGKWGDLGATFYYSHYHRFFDGLEFINGAFTTGAEVTLELKPLSRLSLGGNYTYMHSRNNDNGTRLTDRPNHLWNAFLEGRPMEALQLRLDVNIVGNRLIPNQLGTDIGNIPITFVDENGVVAGSTLPGYVNVNLAATYKIVKDKWHLKNWKVYGKVQNLLNSQYQEKFGFPEPGINFLFGTQATF